MLGGPIIAGATLSRFFALHVFVIPGMLIGFVGLHLLMVLKLGINEWPMPGRIVKRATYEREYHALTKKDGAPFVPYAVWKDLFFAGFILLAIAACAVYFGPFGPTGQPDPTIIQTAPKPDYFFLWLYALLSLLPPSMETPFLLIGPPLAILGLILLPFLSGEGEKSWKRRPIAVLTVLLIAITLGTFTRLAQFAPWSPHMNAWSGDPVPDRFCTAQRRWSGRARSVFQVKQCRNCHSLGETGGQRGPALDSVAVRLTQDQLIRQVIQGGGNMPAYGKNLSPAETTALVAFLETLHPAKQAPARDASRDMALGEAARKLPARSHRIPSMPHTHHAAFESFWASAALDSRGLVYLRGWVRLRRLDRDAIEVWRAGSFLLGTVLDLGRDGFTSGRARPRIADRPHGSTSAAHDAGSSFDLAWRACEGVAAWFTAAIRGSVPRSTFPLAADAAAWEGTGATRILLAGRRRHAGWMAHSVAVYARAAIGNVAWN